MVGLTPELDVFRQLLHPLVHQRFEIEAVRAAVPEELRHLDLVAGVHRQAAATGRRIPCPPLSWQRRDRRAPSRAKPPIPSPTNVLRFIFGFLRWCASSIAAPSLLSPTVAWIPFSASSDRARFMSSVLTKGPRRTRCTVPLPGSSAVCTPASKPINASLAFRLSASAGFWKEPACRNTGLGGRFLALRLLRGLRRRRGRIVAAGKHLVESRSAGVPAAFHRACRAGRGRSRRRTGARCSARPGAALSRQA